MSITESQYDYIKILSDYDSTREADAKDIEEFLSGVSKTDISNLSKKEASDLIQLLLKRTVHYTMICEKVVELEKKEVNSFHFLGEMDACMHHCPDPVIRGDINGCKEFLDYQKMDFEEEDPEE